MCVCAQVWRFELIKNTLWDDAEEGSMSVTVSLRCVRRSASTLSLFPKRKWAHRSRDRFDKPPHTQTHSQYAVVPLFSRRLQSDMSAVFTPRRKPANVRHQPRHLSDTVNNTLKSGTNAESNYSVSIMNYFIHTFSHSVSVMNLAGFPMKYHYELFSICNELSGIYFEWFSVCYKWFNI